MISTFGEFGAKNRTLRVGGSDSDMDYVSFGKGRETLILLPGLGDGITTVRGMAVVLATTYRKFARKYHVYVFSRKNRLDEGYSTRDMARDQAEAMDALGISKAHVMGVSQGGMIAQWLAIDRPELVDRLVLAVTTAYGNDLVRETVGKWMTFAKQGDYKALSIDMAEKMYSERYLKKYRMFYPLLGLLGALAKPKDVGRFLIQASSCMTHDARAELSKIACPTLILGGGRDRIVGPGSSAELAGQIRRSEQFLYEELGHAAYEEARDFNDRVLAFLSSDTPSPQPPR